MCTEVSAWKKPWDDAFVYSLFFHHFEVSEFGCALGGSVLKYALFPGQPIHVQDPVNIMDHCFCEFLVYILIFLSRSFASSTGLRCDKSYLVWRDFLHPFVFVVLVKKLLFTLKCSFPKCLSFANIFYDFCHTQV